jgi:rod shape determining protein RodA
MLAEEGGLMATSGVLLVFLLLSAYGLAFAWRARHHFGRLLVTGISTTFFLYVLINIGMVIGLLPVVGVPLPLISYGGTAMLTTLIGFGLMLSVDLHRDVVIRRYAGGAALDW